MYNGIILFIRSLYNTNGFIPLHEPKFIGNEKEYIYECIDSSFVSSVGRFVDQFEEMLADYTGARYAVATVNGTAALHIALLLAGVNSDSEVITQPLTFVATCNAISYCGAKPVFIDVDMDTMGLSPESLDTFLNNNATVIEGQCINQTSQKIIKACIPMHTFGHPCKINEIKKICDRYNIALIEDAAESMGSLYKTKHTGTFGLLGTISFNGNKIITSGGGGALITNDENLAKKAKHLTTTARVPHKWEYDHDMTGYNYRMPNINAALLCAQLEKINFFIENKRELAERYRDFFKNTDNIKFVTEPDNARSNYWLNAIQLSSFEERDRFLHIMNENGIMTRPAWKLMSELEMFVNSQHTGLSNAKKIHNEVINIPSSVRL